MNELTLHAFLLTLIAGLSTGIGSCIALLARRTNRKFLSISLGFSAGVMVYVSMVEILSSAQSTLAGAAGERAGGWLTAAGFFGGILLIALIDRLVPSEENPHEVRRVERENTPPAKLMRMGALTAMAIALHNFPEGLATFVSALQEPGVAIPIVAAIAIHNIPEGIAVSVPIYQATGSRAKAFFYSFLSGMAEPAGAFLGWILLQPLLAGPALGLLSAAVAGIMVFLSFDELLPSAGAHGSRNSSSCGMTAGMAVMAVSLLLLAVP